MKFDFRELSFGFHEFVFLFSILKVDVVGVQRMLQVAVSLPQVLHRTSLTTTITEDLTGVITMVITMVTTMVIIIMVLVLLIEIVGEGKNVVLHLMDKELVPTLQITMDNNKIDFSSASPKNKLIR